jgi:hypothetical protein
MFIYYLIFLNKLTLIAPSPHPAARNLPSGENLTQNTSLELSLIVTNNILI